MLLALTTRQASGTLARMNTYDHDQILVEQAEQDADHRREVSKQLASALPPDPTLGSDASFLRDYGVPAALFVKQVMLGERDATMEQLACAKMLLPIETRSQATKVTTEVSVSNAVLDMLDALRAGRLTHAEIDAIEAHVERQANDAGIQLH